MEPNIGFASNLFELGRREPKTLAKKDESVAACSLERSVWVSHHVSIENDEAKPTQV